MTAGGLVDVTYIDITSSRPTTSPTTIYILEGLVKMTQVNDAILLLFFGETQGNDMVPLSRQASITRIKCYSSLRRKETGGSDRFSGRSKEKSAKFLILSHFWAEFFLMV